MVIRLEKDEQSQEHQRINEILDDDELYNLAPVEFPLLSDIEIQAAAEYNQDKGQRHAPQYPED